MNFLVLFSSYFLRTENSYCIQYNKRRVHDNTEYTQKNGADQKLIRNLLLTLHGHNVHRQQRKLSKFLMRYQRFAFHA